MKLNMIALFSLLLTCFAGTAYAESTIQAEIAALKAQFAQMQQRLTALEAENAALRAAAPAQQRPVTAALSPRGERQFMPDIGVVGDIVATSTESGEDEEGNDRVSVRHVEVIFGHDIDPYSRFDLIYTLSDFEDPDLEVAALSYWGLPYDTKFKIGRFLPRIGRAVAIHRDQLETVDEPLVVQRYFGIEGIHKTGFEFSNFLPFSWDNPAHEVTIGMIEGGNGEDGETFGNSSRRPTFYARLRNGINLADGTDLDIGASYMLGSSDDDSKNEVNLFGADITFTHSFNAIRKLKLQSEAFFQDRDEGENSSPWGVYALADYRMLEKWSVGTRFDYVEPVEEVENPSRDGDTAWSGMLTFHQSEFARWRFQYQHVNFAEGGDDNRFFLQATVAIGVHKHALQ